MRAHLVQFDIAWEDKPANYARVESLLQRAAIAPGDLILLPEMFDTGFSLIVERTADADGASAAFLSALALRLSVFVQGGITAIGPDARGRNRAIVFSPRGREIARYDKIHPFSFGREPERFSGGDRVATYSWTPSSGAPAHASLSVVPIICYDLRFPELFRAGLSLGGELFAVGANWPTPRLHHWLALLTARAIENQAFVLGVNRCGKDPYLQYPGRSIALGPRGETLAEAGDEDCVLSVEIPANDLRAWRETFPAWKDGRATLNPRLGADGAIA